MELSKFRYVLLCFNVSSGKCTTIPCKALIKQPLFMLQCTSPSGSYYPCSLPSTLQKPPKWARRRPNTASCSESPTSHCSFSGNRYLCATQSQFWNDGNNYFLCFLCSPIFGKYGAKMGAKTCFTTGAVMQGLSGFLFAFLPQFKNVATFIGLSYLLRYGIIHDSLIVL